MIASDFIHITVVLDALPKLDPAILSYLFTLPLFSTNHELVVRNYQEMAMHSHKIKLTFFLCSYSKEENAF